jgi:regulatory protein YycH of two-component signal transduction system YycFG
MKEKLKSYLLAILVIASLFQSYYLAFGKPEFKALQSTGDVQTTWNGETKEVASLIEPQQIVLHFGNERHTVLGQDQFFFEETFKKLTQRSFEGFKQVQSNTINWNQIRNNRSGFEVSFSSGIPVTILSDVIQIKGDFAEYLDFIKTIWITTNAKGDTVKAYFATKDNQYIFEATKVDFIVKDVEQIVGWGLALNQRNNYAWVNNSYYLPENPIPLNKYTYSYSEFTSKQIQSSLFVDPTTSRKLLNQQGVEIYTDGKRGLEIDRTNKWLIYSDPITVPESSTNLELNLQAAVKFVNLHGGWEGKYVLSEMPEDINQAFGFTEYVNGLALFGPNGYIKNDVEVAMKNGLVTNYERSNAQIDIQKWQSVTKVEISGQLELLAKNKEYLDSVEIEMIYPVYVMKYMNNQMIELQPQWAAKQVNGQVRLLQ